MQAPVSEETGRVLSTEIMSDREPMSFDDRRPDLLATGAGWLHYPGPGTQIDKPAFSANQ